MVYIALAIGVIAALCCGFAAGYDAGSKREREGTLLFVMVGPLDLLIAGNIVRLKEGEVLEVKMWEHGPPYRRGGPIDTDPSSPTYDDPRTFKPSTL